MANEQLQQVLARLKAGQSGSGTGKMTLAERRAGMEKTSERAPSDVTCTAVDAGGVPAEWVSAPGADDDRVIMYFHGGGYTMGSIGTHRATAARIARASNARALVLDYRLAPEHPFPAAVDDALRAYRWLLTNGFKPGKIVLAGDSAGGGLTVAALAAIKQQGLPMPAAAVPISPWTDLECTGNSYQTRAATDPMVSRDLLTGSAAAYAGKNSLRNPLISPLHADFHGFPPLLIQVGDAEVLLDDATRVAERAKAAGVKVELEVWPEMIHVFQVFAKILDDGQRAIDKIGRFVIANT